MKLGFLIFTESQAFLDLVNPDLVMQDFMFLIKTHSCEN